MLAALVGIAHATFGNLDFLHAPYSLLSSAWYSLAVRPCRMKHTAALDVFRLYRHCSAYVVRHLKRIGLLRHRMHIGKSVGCCRK
jgi:hypothetical protein